MQFMLLAIKKAVHEIMWKNMVDPERPMTI
jgi:hypothetical protein